MCFRFLLDIDALSLGGKEATPRSKKQIKPFVDFYHINMNDFEPSDINAYNVSLYNVSKT